MSGTAPTNQSPDDSETAAGAARLRPARDPAWLLAGLLILVAVAVGWTHWPALSTRCVHFDDGMYWVRNRLVQNPGWESLGRFFGEVLKPSTVTGYYQPLTMASLMLDWARGARPDRMETFHQTGWALHVLNTVLVGALLYLVFGRAWAAALVALLFGVHPLSVEPVPWVSERKTLLAAFFTLWSLLGYVGWTRMRGWPAGLCYALVIVAFVLALLAKPTCTPLPILLLLLDFWPLRRLRWRAVAEKVPLLIIAGAAALITYLSQKNTAAAEIAPRGLSEYQVPLTLCHNIIFYPWKMLWPANLTSHYAFPMPFDLSQPAVLAGVIGTPVLLLVLLVSLRWTRALATGWLFFFLAILPTMGIVGFTNVIASDKYAYLPVVGLLLVLAAALAWVWRRLGRGAGGRGWRAALVIVLLAVGVAEARAARQYLEHWRDTEALYRYMLTRTPEAPTVLNHLGWELARQYERERARVGLDAPAEKLDEAIATFRHALRYADTWYEPHNNLGTALGNQADRLLGEGRALQQQGRVSEVDLKLKAAKALLDEAAGHFDAATRLRPQYALAWANLGGVRGRLGQREEAQRCYEEALRVDPACIDAHNGLAILLAEQGRFDEAAARFRAGMRANPYDFRAYVGLARVLLYEGKVDEAIAVLEAGDRAVPGHPAVRGTLQRAREARAGRPPVPGRSE